MATDVSNFRAKVLLKERGLKQGRGEVPLREIVNRCSIIVQRALAKGFCCRDVLILGSSSQGDLFYGWEDTSGNSLSSLLYLNCGWGIGSTCKQSGSRTVGTQTRVFSCSCDHCPSDQDHAGFVVQGVIWLMGLSKGKLLQRN